MPHMKKDDEEGGYIFAVTGKNAENLTEYKGFAVINSLTDGGHLADLVEISVPVWARRRLAGGRLAYMNRLNPEILPSKKNQGH